jgi:hypothetical protein
MPKYGSGVYAQPPPTPPPFQVPGTVSTMPTAPPKMPTGGIGKGIASPFIPRWSASPVPMDEKGRPLATEFNTIGDPVTGLLKDQYNVKNTLDPRAMEAARTEAYRDPGTMSRWGQMALTSAQNQNAAQNFGSQAQARSQLAMQGGLRTGARERLAAQGMQNQLRGNQSALGNVQMQDEQNRQKWLGQMPGLEVQNAQYGAGIQDKNIGRAVGEIQTGRALQQRQYDEAMRGWAAGKSAGALSGSDDSGGFLSNLFGAIF